MKNIISILIIVSIFSCRQGSKQLITNDSMGKYVLNKKLEHQVDKNVFDITLNSDKLIKSIMIKSSDYKTADGFGVGSRINDIKSKFKESVIKELEISKGNTVIGSAGNSITYDGIVFIDSDKDNLIDLVWISSE